MCEVLEKPLRQGLSKPLGCKRIRTPIVSKSESLYGPSDWIRTSGRPTASPGRPSGEIEIQEAAGSWDACKKRQSSQELCLFLVRVFITDLTIGMGIIFLFDFVLFLCLGFLF